ncbi:MAG: DUF4446 family protein [Chloroflexota bacterium]|nr:DUF4446 family protein [Chloroflexota bacterium]
MEKILLPWVIAATLLLFLAAYWIYTLEERLNKMAERYARLAALAAELDEPTVINLLQQLEQQGAQLDDAWKLLHRLEAAFPHIVQGYGVVRYDAFPNIGGEQSFSLALVDLQGNGIVLSGLQSREMKIYAKSLVQWRAERSLSSEEQEALGMARKIINA